MTWRLRARAVLCVALVPATLGAAAVSASPAHAVECADVLNIGHRGAGEGRDENTIPHLRKAVRGGVDIVEFDLRLTKDGRLGLMHDPTVRRTTNGRGFVAAMKFRTFDSLRTASGYRPPTFGKVLAAMAPLGVGLQIHLKVDLSDARLASIGKSLRAAGFTADDVQFNADTLPLLQRVEQITGFTTGFTYLGAPDAARIAEVAAYGVDVVMLHRDRVTAEWVTFAETLGVETGARAVTIDPAWAVEVGVRRLVVDVPRPKCVPAPA